MTQPLPPELTASSEQVHVLDVSERTTIIVERRVRYVSAATPIRLTTSIGGSGMTATMSEESARELLIALAETLHMKVHRHPEGCQEQEANDHVMVGWNQ